MATLTANGEGIEGDSVVGQSRKPTIARGLVKLNGQTCYRFVADFDVKARITNVLTAINRLEPIASTLPSDEVICAKANIHSVKNKVTSEVDKGSHSHQTNVWRFPNQTSVIVTASHQEIANAKENARRGLEESTRAAALEASTKKKGK